MPDVSPSRTGRSRIAPAVVTRHEHADGWWELATRDTAPALAACAARYIGYAEQNRAPLRRLEVPHPAVTLIINLGDAIEVHAPALSAKGTSCGSFVAGLFDTVVETSSAPRSRGIEVNLTPLGTWRLTGVPMHELTNRVIALDDVLGRNAARLVEQLHGAPTWDARLDLLDAALIARLDRAPAIPPAVQWAWAQVMHGAPAMRVADLTGELQWSRRRLAAAFREHVGLTPKVLARVVRFDRAVQRVRQLAHTPSVPWSRLAADCGYADQSHLVREFREFATVTPVDFHRRHSPALPGVLAG